MNASLRAAKLALVFAACLPVLCLTAPAWAAPSSVTEKGTGDVSVLYAGSLSKLFEEGVKPKFEKASGFRFAGDASGSAAAAGLIKSGAKTPDVFVSSDPAVNESLAGTVNGNRVAWWVPFARNEMVVAWSPLSPLAPKFKEASRGVVPPETVLRSAGIKIGRANPEADPKGYRTLFTLELDEKRTCDTTLRETILGADTNPSQILADDALLSRLRDGSLDAGFMYRSDAVSAALPFLNLPPQINLGDPSHAAFYATVGYTNSSGQAFTGSPIAYTAAVLETARNRSGGISLVQFLLSTKGSDQLAGHGFLPASPVAAGDASKLPSQLSPYLVPAPVKPSPAPAACVTAGGATTAAGQAGTPGASSVVHSSAAPPAAPVAKKNAGGTIAKAQRGGAKTAGSGIGPAGGSIGTAAVAAKPGQSADPHAAKTTGTRALALARTGTFQALLVAAGLLLFISGSTLRTGARRANSSIPDKPSAPRRRF